MATKIPSDYFTQSGVFENRYINCPTPDEARVMSRRAIVSFGLNAEPLLVSPNKKHWVIKWCYQNVWVEPRTYDYIVPESATKLVEVVYDTNFKILVFVAPMTSGGVVSSTKVDLLLASKENQYLPKCWGLDHCEIGWVAYNTYDEINVVHHIQLHGHVKGALGYAERMWLFRYMMWTYNHLVYNKKTLVPSGETLRQLHINTNHPRIPPIESFGKHVLGKCNYRRATGKEIALLDGLSPISSIISAPKFWISR